MLFLSTYTNRIDKKGRLSIPASFRAALSGQEFSGIVVIPSLINPCIEASGMDRLHTLQSQIDALDPLSFEHDAFATTLLAQSVALPFDSEGRVNLPPSLLEALNLSDEVVLAGKGRTFECWAPKVFAEHAEKARAHALAHRHTLRAQPPERKP